MLLRSLSSKYISQSFRSEDYQLLHKIGEGGFGQVFKAKHKNTAQMVAIKFLSLDVNNKGQKQQRYIERFKRESELISQLQHPHIVRLSDKGNIGDALLYSVFEYIDGITLNDHLRQVSVLDPVTASDIMLQVLDALIHAHKKGIIHRDIKPANIMLMQTGTKLYVKILDFGVSTLVAEHRQHDFHTLTLTQETLGTPSYSAPEQLRGEPATAKTDLYVWGLVFLECLTGSPAVTGSSIASIYHQQLSGIPISLPRSLLSHPLGDLLRRVLQKNVTERVISSTEILAELNRINVANLVGSLADGRIRQSKNDATVVLRADDPNHIMSDYTALTERKQITVLALRLSIKAINGLEKDSGVIDTLQKAQRNQCIDIATRFGAYHVGNLGDMLLFYFGFPMARDDDTRLSARAALDMINALNKRNALMQDTHHISLNPHIGIHTGIFIIYAKAIPEGHIANTAMALANLAAAKQIVCSADIRAILEPYSEFEYVDTVQLGLAFDPLPVFNLKAERRIEAFGFMRGTRNHHALIGRQTELDKALTLINDTKQPNRIAHIYGEAGIGKSRLLQEIRVNASQYQHLVSQCLPEHQNNALYPILTLIRHLFNTEDLSATESITLLNNILSKQASELNLEQVLPILLVWLNIELNEELNEEMTPSALAPDTQKELLFKGLTALLLSQQYSIDPHKLYIIEDIHWADTTTLEFIQFFTPQLTSDHVFISTSRQARPDSLQPTTLTLKLDKLTAKATENFIIKLFDNQSVSRKVLQLLTSRTDGIPLFIEELVGMLQQKELVQTTDGEINFVSPDKLEQVPNSLRESLQQKLDSLVYAKETAQLAATIGREFDYELLVTASSLSEGQIQNDLNELIENDIIIQQRRVDNNSYLFKHALVRDAAYDSIPMFLKKEQHNSVALTMQSYFSERWTNTPIEIASHFAKGDNFTSAIKLGIKQLSSSLQKSSNEALLSVGEIVLQWNKHIKEVDLANRQTLKIYTLMFPGVMAVHGFGSKKLVAFSKNIRDLSSFFQDEESSQIIDIQFFSNWIIFVDHQFHSRCKEAIELANEIIRTAQNNNERQQELLVLPLLGQTYHLKGMLPEAEKCCLKALNIYNVSKDFEIWKTYGIEVKSQALFLLSHILAAKGEIDTARNKASEALMWGKKTGCTMTVDGSYLFSSMVAYLEHDPAFIQALEIQHKNFHKENFLPGHWLVGYSMMGYDWTNNKTNHHQYFIDYLLSEGRSGALCWWEGMLAETYTHLGQTSKAIALMEETINRCESNGEIGSMPLLKRSLALALAKDKGVITDNIICLFKEAIAAAKKQGAIWLMLDVFYNYHELLDNNKNEYGGELIYCKKELRKLTDLMTEGKGTPLFKKVHLIIKKEILK